MSGKELEGTFSEAKEKFRCSCTFSLTLPLIPISVGARMRRGGKCSVPGEWMAWQRQNKEGFKRGLLCMWLIDKNVYTWARISCLLLSTGNT